jgi:CDP-diacylglycerol---glycerol-3-phosphate 3-phosphatidyltransferase
MLSARPYLDSQIPAAEYAEARLRGTVWQHVASARLCYRALMAVGRTLGRAGVSANALTYGSLVFALAAAIAGALGHFATAAALVLVSGVLDVLDGVVARATGTVTSFGALLDSTVDRLADGLPLLGVTIFYGQTSAAAAIPALAMLGGFTVSYVRARAGALGVVLPALFMRRAERVILVIVSLLLGTVPVLAPVQAPLLLGGLGLMALLNLVASGAALRSAKNELSAASARAR